MGVRWAWIYISVVPKANSEFAPDYYTQVQGSAILHGVALSSVMLPLWRHQMETFSALPALYEVNSPVTDEFPS